MLLEKVETKPQRGENVCFRKQKIKQMSSLNNMLRDLPHQHVWK